MKNESMWTPTRLVQDPSTGHFRVNATRTYGGSLYLADLQWRYYEPLMREHLRGDLLDIGCGAVPYFGFYRSQVRSCVCVDHPTFGHGKDLLDLQIDLNNTERLPFDDASFDSILASDMIAHIQLPDRFVSELSRVLRPGGTLFLSSTFINWLGEYPNEFGHPSGPGLRFLAERSGLEVVHLGSYGGHADVLLDTLNKFFPSGFFNRVVLVLIRLVASTGWPARNRPRTRDRYALGNVLIARKPQ